MTGDGAVSDFAMNLRCIGANRLRPTRVRQLESLNVTREANNTTQTEVNQMTEPDLKEKTQKNLLEKLADMVDQYVIKQ